MIVRIIGTKECSQCNRLQAEYRILKFPFEFYDAELEAHQNQLDAWQITNMPVLQIIEKDKVLHQFPPGPYRASLIKAKMADLEKNNAV